MWLQVLGSAAGGGFPQWNCGCPGCSAVRDGLPARPSAHPVVGRGERRPAALVPAQRLARRPGPDRGLPRRCTRARVATPRCGRCCSPTPSSTTRSACCCCGRRRASRCTPPRPCTRRSATARACWPRWSATAGWSWRPVTPGVEVSARRGPVLPGLRRADHQAGALRHRRRGGPGGGLPVHRRAQRTGRGVPAGRAAAHAGGARGAGGLRGAADRRHLLARRRDDPARPRRQDLGREWATCPSAARTAAWNSWPT